MSNTRLFLIRHAEVEARYQKVFGGRVDMDISPHGEAQAAALAGWLHHRPLDAIYASPMKRVQRTLTPLAHPGGPVPTILPDLREVDFGDWTGLSWSGVSEQFGVSPYDWLHHLECGAIPNAESPAACRDRIEPCLGGILRRHPGQSVAIFCHGGVIRMMLSLLLDLPLSKTTMFEIDYASVTEVVVNPQRTGIQLLNFSPWRTPGV